MRNRHKFILLALLMVFAFPLTVHASETDLQISVETITMREYAGGTVTDRYDVDLLTEVGYRNAAEVKARLEQSHLETQSALFAADGHEESETVDLVASKVAQLALFGDGYTISETTVASTGATRQTLWTVLTMTIAALAGLFCAGAIQKRTGGRAG